MAEASPLLLTVTPKELGRHLREVRRKKGLSLSEVARGAGLSRRELVAYERGKVPIPESDLWVLAGSCGVDASELVPRTVTPELPAAPTSMGDTVAQLRRGQAQADLAPYLATINRLQALPPGKRIPVKERELEEIATALGREPEAIEQRLTQVMHVSPAEAARLREMILPPVAGPHRPRALEAAPTFTEMAAEAPGAVDVFEELARLPEPIPLADPGEPLPDMFATPPAPEGAVELVESTVPAAGAATNGFATMSGAIANGAVPGTLADPAAVERSAADAPPIDVALRQSSDAWADWGKVPAPPTIEARRGTSSVDDPFADATPGDGSPDSASGWEPPPWQPGGTDGTPANGTPPAFWEGTDDWEPPADSPADLPADAPIDAWTSHEWPADLAGEPTIGEGEPAPNGFDTYLPLVDSNGPTIDDWSPVTASPYADPGLPDGAARTDFGDNGPWSHEPDPEAVSTGFYVDWGTPDDEPPAWHALIGADPSVDDPQGQVASEAMAWREPDTRVREPGDPFFADPFLTEPAPAEFSTAPEPEVEPAMEVLVEADTLAPIMWRADAHQMPALEAGPDSTDPAAPDAAPDPTEALAFAVAGSDWQLGNALPLVEVRGQGALVMRRADERWALADLVAPSDCVVEVDLDFRSGPGLGVLFRAHVDDDGRMSGYSFDIDPIYDGGGYLVRQWQSDRELWNPIARISAADPNSMYGMLTVRLTLHDDHLVAEVNGAEVLTVESLKQASADRGREAAAGDRVGVQAWSSSDLVIETLRVAEL